jgi:hypothetical protein
VYGVSDKVLSMALSTLLIAAPRTMTHWDARMCGGRVDEEVAHPHPSQSRTCRFPASGSSWESLARSGVTMDNSRCWERVGLEPLLRAVTEVREISQHCGNCGKYINDPTSSPRAHSFIEGY